MEAPWFVADKDFNRNILIVAQGHDNPALFHKELMANQVHWISGSSPKKLSGLSAKIRYRQADQNCQITHIKQDQCTVTFDQPQFAVTPGQSIVFYQGDECLGGAIIDVRN